MRRALAWPAAVILALAPAPAQAQERDFCANRPGIGTPPCTLAPGNAMIEATIAAWDHSADAATIGDQLTVGDLAMRMGVTPSTEIQFGLTSYIRDRERDRASGAVSHTSGRGDAFIAVRQGLAGPNGPVALQGFITVPPGAGRQVRATGAWACCYPSPCPLGAASRST